MKLRPCLSRPTLTFNEVKMLDRNFERPESLPERTSSIELGLRGPISKWNARFLFDYKVFPSWIIRFEAEWTKAARTMAVGDLILQRVLLPPVGFGLCLEFAVRICSVIQDERRLGFAYETLAGHVERGISEFYFEEQGGQILFTIHTLSEPAFWMARLTKHVFALPYQAWCTKQALKQVRHHFWEANGISESINMIR